MRVRIIIIVAVALPMMAMGHALPAVDTIPARDSAQVAASDSTRAEEKSRSGLSKLVRRMLFINKSGRVERHAHVVDEAKLLERFDGKLIRSITYDRHDVFEDKRTRFRALGNGMHMRTVETALERDLLFHTGDAFDAKTAVSSNQIVRGRSYISDSRLDVKLNPEDSTQVDITLVTYDKWTIGVSASVRSRARAMFNIYDHNFLGMGNRVGAQTFFKYKKSKYYGNVFDYENLNLLGTFYTAAFKLGHDYENTYTDFSISKNFLLPSDYEAGASLYDDKFSRFSVFAPDTLANYSIHRLAINAWGGWSHALPSSSVSVYAVAHYLRERFTRRPEQTSKRMHPLFHNRDEVLFGAGLYRERFLSSTKIYGYGPQEYIASGAKFQIIGGYSWQEFGNYWYAGFTCARGGFTEIGYLCGETSIGSYVDTKTGKLWQSALDMDGGWFSNLLDAGRGKMRLFLNAHYTHGWNRGEGAGSLVRFSNTVRPTSFDTYAAGKNRFLINTQAVIFTPFRPLGFDIALFGFADVGWIGNRNNVFHNNFFSTFGIGMRFKNERLVFGALQFRLGFAVGKKGWLHNNMVRLSTEQRMSPYRFIPSRPETVHFE